MLMHPLQSMKASGLRKKANDYHTLLHETQWVVGTDAKNYLAPCVKTDTLVNVDKTG